MRTYTKWLAAVVIVLSGGAEVGASSPCGIVARIDEVTVGPNVEQPAWILIKGDFLVALTSRRHVGPDRGYIRFSLASTDNSRASAASKQKEKCLIEWGDLKALVEEKGMGKAYVAFGSVFSEELDNFPEAFPTAQQAQKNPFPYPIHHGLTRLRTPGSQSGDQGNPVLMLRDFQAKKDGAAR